MSASNSKGLSTIKNFDKYLEKIHDISCHRIFSVKNSQKAKISPKPLFEEDSYISIEHINDFSELKWIELRNKALLVLICATGLRISEALSITKIHLKNTEFIRIVGKGNKERLISWVSVVRELILKYLSKLPYDLDAKQPVFRGKMGKKL